MDFGGIQDAGPLVLIVDDDDALRTVLAAMLAWFGFRTWSSADGGAVLELPGLAQVRCAFVDCHLPIHDGRALADRLADHGVPVMLMSGDPRVASTAAARHAFLAKPFDMDCVQALLEGHGLYPMREGVVVRTDHKVEVNAWTAL